MKARVLSAVVSMLSAGMIAACSSDSAPAAPTTVPVSIAISGARPLVEGETVALVATLRSSTGATTDVTRTATWSSSAPEIATVDNQGIVTALTAGSAEIRATTQGLTGASGLTIGRAPRTISGTVRESAPTEGTVVAGATVAVVDAAGASRSVVSDATGRFSVGVSSGAARITATAPGYETTTAVVDATADVTALGVNLVPVLREVRFNFPALPVSPNTLELERTFPIVVHHAGEIRVALTEQTAFHSSGEALFRLELRNASNRVLVRSSGVFDAPPPPIRVNVGPGLYEVKLWIDRGLEFLRQFPNFSTTTFGGEIKHPS